MSYEQLAGIATHVFYADGCILDFINPSTGRSAIARRTLEEMQAVYPGAQVMEKEAAYIAKEAADRDRYCKKPTPITAKDYQYMLCELPPMHWRGNGNTESFKMSEFTTGNITAIYARIGEQHYALVDDASLTHDEIIARCLVT